jgi:hypothetical protein
MSLPKIIDNERKQLKGTLKELSKNHVRLSMIAQYCAKSQYTKMEFMG